MEASAASLVRQWAQGSQRVLFALDAPLGWPAEMGRELVRHRAGAPLVPAAHSMFRRMTDDEIYRRFGKRPLEVAADRIARPAHAALKFLAATRIVLGLPRGSGSLAELESRVRFEGTSKPVSEHARDA
jgi:hypothetical protein